MTEISDDGRRDRFVCWFWFYFWFVSRFSFSRCQQVRDIKFKFEMGKTGRWMESACDGRKMRRRWRWLIYYVDEKKLSSLIIVQTMFRINLNLSMKWGCHAFKYFCVALTGSHTHTHPLTAHSAAAGQRTDAKNSADRTKAASDMVRWYTSDGRSQKPKKGKTHTHEHRRWRRRRRRKKTASSLFNPLYFMVFDILIFFFFRLWSGS